MKAIHFGYLITSFALSAAATFFSRPVSAELSPHRSNLSASNISGHVQRQSIVTKRQPKASFVTLPPIIQIEEDTTADMLADTIEGLIQDYYNNLTAKGVLTATSAIPPVIVDIAYAR